MTIETPR